MLDAGALDRIVKVTIEAVENSKAQIFSISEDARAECARVQKDLNEIRLQALEIISKVDDLTAKEQKARIRLMEVSRDIHKYSEDDIRIAYEFARDMQIELAVLRERELQSRLKRDDLERRLKHLQGMVERAELLISQVGVVLNVLQGNLQELNVQLEEIQYRQQLGLRIILAQEEERRRVARDIHDGPAQMMSNIVLRAELCERLLELQPERVKEELKELKELVRASLQDVRKIIYDLRPMALDDLGLVPALKRYLTDYEEKHGLHTEVRMLGEERRLDTALEVAVFRIIQEALTNVRKHAKAYSVRVRFEMAPERLTAIIRDDGVGFEPEEVLENNPGHFGLLGMRERAELLRGSLEIKSKKGQGTEIVIRIPLDNEGEQ